ncbi:MAG: NUDIX domain-containing protein [Acholeplasmataceae bacterium]
MKTEISCGIILYKYQDNQRKFLLIKHQNGGHYGFPKGHMEQYESKKQTALREVKEETNLDAYIIGNYYQKVTYSPKQDVIKDVYYYLGKVYKGELICQSEEVQQALWINEQDLCRYLTYDNDKLIINKMIKKINILEKGINYTLMAYIEQNVIPGYNLFDEAHHADHVYNVIFDSLKLAKSYHLNPEIIYTIAAFHDLGLVEGRENHHILGGKILEKDEFIKTFFNKETIQLMVDAIYDHRASNGVMPRSIYGKIIAEADRQMNANQIILRTAKYEMAKHPNLTVEEHVAYCYQHMIEKYSENGYLQLCLDIGKNVKELSKLRKIINNSEKIKAKFRQIISK